MSTKVKRLRLSLCSATSSQLHILKFILFYVYRFTDINECKVNHSCHVNATCMNTKGSYVCTCHPGYTGNGSDCTGTWCISFESISKKHYHICETCFTSIPCIDPFTPKISLVILLTVYHIILMMLVQRIWYWINW